MTPDADGISTLLDAALRLLAHRLRTPLSVISNDLYFLESSGMSSDLGGSREKIEEISLLLKQLAPTQLPATIAQLEAGRLSQGLEFRLSDGSACFGEERLPSALARTLYYVLQASELERDAATSEALRITELRFVLDSQQPLCRAVNIRYHHAFPDDSRRLADSIDQHPSNLFLRLAVLSAVLAQQTLETQRHLLVLRGLNE